MDHDSNPTAGGRNPSGNSKQRRHMAREEKRKQKIVAKAVAKEKTIPAETIPTDTKPMAPPTVEEPRGSFWTQVARKKNDIIALGGVLASFGSWGYTVLTPQTPVAFGLFLMGVAFACAAMLIIHIFNFKLKGWIATSFLIALSFWLFAKNIVIAPLYKREMLSQLQKGYGIRTECGNRGAYEQTPPWMRDSQENWKATVTSLLEHAGYTDDLQRWQNSQLIGLATDGNYNGFRCTDLAVKVGALETIIAKHYDTTIKPSNYDGPVYVFNPSKGGTMQERK